MLRIQSHTGLPLDVRLVLKGERWGREDCLVHDKADPLVEYYHPHPKHGPRGYRVSYYSASTLFESRHTDGIALSGHERQFDVPAEEQARVLTWLALHVRLSVTADGETEETLLAAFLADNAEDAETCRKVRTLPIGESVDLGGGACPVVRVTNLGFKKV